MGWRVVKQPDGLLAVWSTVVDDWIAFDCTADEVVEMHAEDAARSARAAARSVVGKVLAGEQAYFQFTRTFAELQAQRCLVHGSAPWPPVDDDAASAS